MLEHLLIKTKGIKTIDCTTYLVVKGYEIVSCILRAQATIPFLRIHFDLIELPTATILRYK